MSGNITPWPILRELEAFRLASYDQRNPVLSNLGADKRVEVGACPGLSLEWIKRHRQYPNETPVSRMNWMRKDGVLWQAAEYTDKFNRPASSNKERLGGDLTSHIGLNPNHHWKQAKPEAKDTSKLYLTYFNPANRYSILLANLEGLNTDHMCATYCYEGRRGKMLVIFDPNFGEFSVPLTASDMRRFMEAWSKQFTTYVSGRTGKAVKLTLKSVEVISLDEI
ncbi:YopT-type cysteine protease domain-containing protein [Chitinivorax sp. B]|uniref:YopT-type cysteine protease domain-containing protein n=1 Tax=Chitinivorax sp. B TaxID=2502235 RepID=UPI0010F9A74A|nr:YopT-type cysteine protease domain-containing protein [Chitinivorax sp. B]